MSEEKILGIGNLLKSQREKLGLSLEDIEQQTFINKRYLKAIEEEQWEVFLDFLTLLDMLKTMEGCST